MISVLAPEADIGETDELLRKLRRTNSSIPEDAVHCHAAVLRTLFGTLQGVRNKVVLDLGCGSTQGGEGRCSKDFEPWFSRMVHALGGQSVGIDLFPNDHEPFEHHTRDLTHPDALTDLPSGSFDVVHNSFFLPTHESDDTETATSPVLKATLHHNHALLADARGRLSIEINRLLHNEGLYTCQRSVYRKTDERLIYIAEVEGI